MQASTIVFLACLVAAVVAQAQYEPHPAEQTVEGLVLDTPQHEASPRDRRSLLLLKKKLILGTLGLKAAKVGVAAGAVGALAYKAHSSKSAGHAKHTYYHHGPHPSVAVEVHRW